MITPQPTGISRFIFGYAEPGEQLVTPTGVTIEFVGNFSRMKDANASALASGGKAKGYLHGKLKRGWAVWKTLPAAS